MHRSVSVESVLAVLLACAVALGACGARDSGQAASGARSAAPAAPLPSPVAPSPAPAAEVDPTPASSAPVAQAGPLYVCAMVNKGAEQRTPIELTASVDALCRKAPEMGPCQYEREACRRKGGRVWTADGREITRKTEAEYDRRVMRVRMKSN